MRAVLAPFSVNEVEIFCSMSASAVTHYAAKQEGPAIPDPNLNEAARACAALIVSNQCQKWTMNKTGDEIIFRQPSEKL